MDIFIFIGDVTRVGGTERAVSNLSALLCDLNYNVTVVSVCTSNGEMPYYKIASKASIIHLGLNEIGSSVIRKIIWQIKAIIKVLSLNISSSICIGTGHNMNSMLAVCKLVRRDIKVVGCEHIQVDTIPASSRKVMRFLYKNLDKIVVLSNSAKQKVKSLLRKADNVVVIPNSLPFYSESYSSLEQKQIIMVGRFSQEKGYERVVPIATALKSLYPTWKIVIYGTGPLKDKIANLYKEQHLDNIILYEPVTDIQNKYLESSIYMMTSYNEAMPMVILEANSCGLPVVAYECEGSRELVQDDVNGYIIKSDDKVEFINKLSVLIREKSLRHRMSEAAISCAKRYSNDNVSLLWKNLIENL